MDPLFWMLLGAALMWVWNYLGEDPKKEATLEWLDNLEKWETREMRRNPDGNHIAQHHAAVEHMLQDMRNSVR